MQQLLFSFSARKSVEIRVDEKSERNERIFSLDVVSIILSCMDSVSMMKTCPKVCRQWYGCSEKMVLRLDLTDRKVTSKQLKSLVCHPFTSNITSLVLNNVNLDKSALQVFCSDSTWAVNISVLNLSNNKLEGNISFISKFKGLSNVTDLNLSGNELDELAIESLCSSPYLTKLKLLCLENNCLGMSGLSILCSSPNMKSLTSLNISSIDNYVPISILHPFKALRAIATSDMLPNFFIIVANSEFMSNLTHLNISNLEVSFGKCLHLENLKDLVLANCVIGDSEISKLAALENLVKVEKLDLSGNCLTDNAAFVIASGGGIFKNLHFLNMLGNTMTNNSIELIQSSLPNLTLLH